MLNYRLMPLMVLAWCSFYAAIAHAETITALAIHDTYFYDRDENRNRNNGGDVENRVALGVAGGSIDVSAQTVQGIIFEQDKLEGFAPSEVVKATFKMELTMI